MNAARIFRTAAIGVFVVMAIVFTVAGIVAVAGS